MICEAKCSKPYPGSDQHNSLLQELFEKRNMLAHNKPKKHTILSSNSFDDYNTACKELSFVFDNIDAEIELYEEVKKNLIDCTNTDPFQALINTAAESMSQAIIEMLTCVNANENNDS